MIGNGRIRACYQRCALRHQTNEAMSNQTLRERFGLSTARSDTASKIIRDTLGMELVKPADPANRLSGYARYVPFWA